MEVHFTPEQEAQLSRIATHTGTDVEHLVKNAALQVLEEDERFRAAVERGEAAIERGDYLMHEEVGKHIEQLFAS